MASQDPLIGTYFDGRYKIVRKLGAGGMANVYLAEDQELGRRVAIKILNDRHANDDQFVERFRREAKNAAALSHPNIVSIYDRGEAEGTYYIAMEFLDGRSLKELIVTRGPAPVPVAVEYTRQILSALRFAHRHGIVHRDIKPHNVLVDGEGRVKVTDFGIARAGASQMTEAGSIVGTAQYLSPEQARGTNVDQRSDLYSLGVVLYELLTGAAPFGGDTPVEIAMKHLSQTPEPPSAKRPNLPHDLDLLVMRALAKDPEERYQSAEEMDADLERVARGVAVSRETEESATQIISAATGPMAATAATMIAPPPRAVAAAAPPPSSPPPQVYYDLDEPIHRRPIWPWIAALAFVVGAVVGGWFLYKQISNKISSNAPVAVEYYVNMTETDATQKIESIGLKASVEKGPNMETAPGLVYKQNPTEGTKIPKGNPVTIWVSTGKPKVAVPTLVGQQETDAVNALKQLKLKPDVHEVNSNVPQNQVTAQDPKAGTKVVVGTSVRINVSKGPQPVTVPGVVGDTIDQATSTLQAANFKVTTAFVDSNQPANTVVDQSPAAGTSAGKGSTVSLSVSRGPKTTQVPDVTNLDVATATNEVQAANLKVRIVNVTVTDPSQDGIVQSQNPQAGQQAPLNSTVTINVGRFTGSTTTATTTAPTP
ncbi:MAG TPA: Stk1 family PASTA domain-containing Ser/Thr kinase [Gaiellaceae bacterium]|nr:Stk1 family PASTA domain-containing Ser/Thr kinase [Gaiellaceae bacterium]